MRKQLYISRYTQVHIRVLSNIFGMDGVETLLDGNPADVILTALPLAAV